VRAPDQFDHRFRNQSITDQESFFNTEAGRVLLALLELADEDDTKHLFWQWFQRCGTQAERDAALHCVMADTSFLLEWVMQASADALALYAVEEDADLVYLLVGHREAPRLIRRLVCEAKAPRERTRAAMYLIMSGEQVMPFNELALQVALVAQQWPGDASAGVPWMVPQVEALLATDGATLCATSAPLGRALHRAMSIAKAAEREDLFRQAFEAWLLALKDSASIDSTSSILRDHVSVDDKVKLRQVAERIASLPPSQREKALRHLPVPLATAWARSPKTPHEVRIEAAWAALQDPDFNARDCDLSTDPRLVATLLDRVEIRREFGGGLRGPLGVLKVLLRATVNLLVREPPSSEELEEQAQPYFRLRQGLRMWMLAGDELGPELAESLREDLVDRVKNSLREVHHKDGQLTVHLKVTAWLRCSAILRDPRLLEVVKTLGNHLSDRERVLLNEPLESALQELTLPRNQDDVEAVVMAVRALRIEPRP
jgi:hypothetical protein